MKKYIDYLFWKRSWFRTYVIMFPTWVFPYAFLFGIGEAGSFQRDVICVIYLGSVLLGIYDNDNIDSPPNPL